VQIALLFRTLRRAAAVPGLLATLPFKVFEVLRFKGLRV
jgi:hypothetical protein